AEAISSALVRGRTPPPVSQGTAVGVACQRRLTEETGGEAEVEPAPAVRGSVLPVPARITLLKRPAYGRGGWLTAPSFLLRLDPRVPVAGPFGTGRGEGA